jgi:hypothetical protein
MVDTIETFLVGLAMCGKTHISVEEMEGADTSNTPN